MSILEVLRLRATSPFSRDKSMRRFAQDDVFVWRVGDPNNQRLLGFLSSANELARGGCALGSDVPTRLIDRPDLRDSEVSRRL